MNTKLIASTVLGQDSGIRIGEFIEDQRELGKYEVEMTAIGEGGAFASIQCRANGLELVKLANEILEKVIGIDEQHD